MITTQDCSYQLPENRTFHNDNLRRRCCQPAGCSRAEQWHHGGSSAGRLLESVEVYFGGRRYILKGFFLTTRNTVSSNSMYLVI